MKTVYLFLALSIFPYSFICNTKASNGVNETKSNKGKQKYFKILKIDSIQKVYVIYASKNDSTFKIVSAKKDSFAACVQIRKGKFYDLKIISIFPQNFYQKKDISNARFGGTLVKLEGNDVVWDLFVCENLSGLCYIK